MERYFCASNLRQGGRGEWLFSAAKKYKVEYSFKETTKRLKFLVIGYSYKPKLNTFFGETT